MLTPQFLSREFVSGTTFRCSLRSIRPALLGLTALAGVAVAPVAAQATPSATCASTATPAASSMHDQSSHAAEHQAADISFDQLYIDMMVPHHESVIALAEVALPDLTDPVLVGIATNIVALQTEENLQLLEWRQAWFGSDVMAMDDATMTQMLAAMPVGSMDEMMFQMDPEAQVAAFCTADDPDLAFASQVLAHHQMAVDASEIAVDQATQPELVEFAEQVIIDQQAEIDILVEFLNDNHATPTA